MTLAFGTFFRTKRSGGRLSLPGITSSNNVKAIGYKEALSGIRSLRGKLVNAFMLQPNRQDFFWLAVYILALYAQEEMIDSINDELIFSDVPWDGRINIPSVSSTVGDAISYAERLKDPKDNFLKALLLSFSGWTLLSTEKKKCACGKGELKEVPVNVLVNSSIQVDETHRFRVEFFVGVQSDDQDHLEQHYSFKEKSVRDNDLIVIHNSQGVICGDNTTIFNDTFKQAEQFRADGMAKILNGLIDSFIKEA